MQVCNIQYMSKLQCKYAWSIRRYASLQHPISYSGFCILPASLLVFIVVVCKYADNIRSLNINDVLCPVSNQTYWIQSHSQQYRKHPIIYSWLDFNASLHEALGWYASVQHPMLFRCLNFSASLHEVLGWYASLQHPTSYSGFCI